MYALNLGRDGRILSAAAVSGLPCHAAVLMNETGFCVKHECFTVMPEHEPEPEEE